MSTATISCSTPDAIIRYEIGGVDPTESSPLYSTPVEFSGEIRAKAWKEGMEASDIAVAVEEDDVPYYYKEYDVTYTPVKSSSDKTYEYNINFTSETPENDDLYDLLTNNKSVMLKGSYLTESSGMKLGLTYKFISSFITMGLTNIKISFHSEYDMGYDTDGSDHAESCLTLTFDSLQNKFVLNFPYKYSVGTNQNYTAFFDDSANITNHKLIICGFEPTT